LSYPNRTNLASVNLSLLQRVESIDIQRLPFPHIVIENALPIEFHDELRATFPTPSDLGVDPTRNNHRWSTKALDLPRISSVTNLWRRFINYHSSQLFWDDVVRVFGEVICKQFPHQFKSPHELLRFEVNVRDLNSTNKHSLELDAQISGNTPVRTPGVPRGVHVDAPNALYAGLYYLRQTDDCSEGGDLQLWEWKEGYSYRKKSSAYKEGVDARHLRLTKTVSYRSNTLVFLINSLDALHSVTERKPTTNTRQFVNLVCDTPSPLFQLRPFFHRRVISVAKRTVRNTL